MSAGRTTMIGGGCGFITLGSLALLARYLEMGSLSSLALGQPGGLYHTLTVGTILSGLILVIFAPPSRRSEHRVRLDLDQPFSQATSRATGKAAPVVTNGNGQRNATTGNVAAPPSPPAARIGLQSAPAPTSYAPAVAGTMATQMAAHRQHPNDATQDQTVDGREALLSRLDELNRRANEIKVRYGLGKVSPGGYRRFIDELDVERSQIEARLLEPEV